jgi:hypothetical protein
MKNILFPLLPKLELAEPSGIFRRFRKIVKTECLHCHVCCPSVRPTGRRERLGSRWTVMTFDI